MPKRTSRVNALAVQAIYSSLGCILSPPQGSSPSISIEKSRLWISVVWERRHRNSLGLDLEPITDVTSQSAETLLGLDVNRLK